MTTECIPIVQPARSQVVQTSLRFRLLVLKDLLMQRVIFTILKEKKYGSIPNLKRQNPDQTSAVKDPFVQEHINLVTGIRTGNVVNDAEAQVMSTLVTIMGRESAYTGKDVTWEEIMNSDMRLGPKTYEFGPVPGVPETIPVIGIEPNLT